jgi:hypothetical protein
MVKLVHGVRDLKSNQPTIVSNGVISLFFPDLKVKAVTTFFIAVCGLTYMATFIYSNTITKKSITQEYATSLSSWYCALYRFQAKFAFNISRRYEL